MSLEFRPLKAHEIEVRIQQVFKGDKGARLLLYKDARCDMNILDEVVGPFNWKREHTRNNANCIVSIWDDKKEEWVSKEDTGAESNQDAQKGLASDSFKRACFNWGIGRELYTAPDIMVWREGDENLKYAKFKVKEIDYDDKRSINKLVIVDENGKVRYTYGTGGKKQEPKQNKTYKIRQRDIEKIKSLYTEDEIKVMLQRLQLNKLFDLTVPQAKKMIEAREEE